MKLRFLAMLALAVVSCAPAANPFDAHPAKLGQQWSFSARDLRSKLEIEAVIDLNSEQSVQGDAYTISGEVVGGAADGNLAGIIYAPKRGILAAFAFVKVASTFSQSQIAYCYAKTPSVNSGRDYSGYALIDRLQTIIDGKASASPDNPCRFTARPASASSPRHQRPSLEMQRAVQRALQVAVR